MITPILTGTLIQVDSTTLLLVVIAVASVFYLLKKNDSASAESRALQDTVRLLLSERSRSSASGRQSPAPDSNSLPVPLNIPTESTFQMFSELSKLQNSIKKLEQKNRELSRQLTLTEVSNVVDYESKYRFPIDSGASAPRLSASEIETIRAIFNAFDTQQNGSISVKEIKALHAKLGEPLTDEEAIIAAGELDQDGSGAIDFNRFLHWWYENHKGGKRSSAYTQRFKLIHAKLSQEAFNMDKVITQESGEMYTLEWRLNFYYKQQNQALKPISPWHDIPLYRVGMQDDGQIFNFVCEIPKWTRAKFECATGELYNPIKQDTQHGKLRYYKHGDMMFNYGYFPQTWEDPDFIPTDTKCPGDNDPIDCVEIGAKQIRVGSIVAVKILGLLALIDDGETDWKIIAISISDPMAHLLNDIDDVEVHVPGAVKAIREYFRDYKSFSGKINTYALSSRAMPKHYAVQVIEETHSHWKGLHLVNKRDVIGQSSTQESGRASLPLDQGVGEPRVEQRGMEQPMEKLD